MRKRATAEGEVLFTPEEEVTFETDVAKNSGTTPEPDKIDRLLNLLVEKLIVAPEEVEAVKDPLKTIVKEPVIK